MKTFRKAYVKDNEKAFIDHAFKIFFHQARAV